MTIFKFALMKGLRNPLNLLFSCIMPIVLIFIRPLWVEGFTLGYGLLIMAIGGGAFLMAQSILTDKTSGAINRILSTPVTMTNYLIQNLLAFMVPLIAQILLVSVLGTALYSWSVEFGLAFFLCFSVFTIASVTLGFALNCLLKHKESSFTALGFLLVFGSFLSGFFIPLEQLPVPVQYAGTVFPSYWAFRGITYLLSDGVVTEYWLALLPMVIFTGIYLLYGGKRRII